MNKHIIIGIVGFLLVSTLLIINFSPTPMIVLSGSMKPIMMIGDVIIVSPVEPEDIKVLDIIAFKDSNSVVTHRVIFITDTNEFQTKGDANEGEDGFIVEGSDVIGKVIFVIPYVGYLTEVTKNPKVFFFVVIIPALLIIIDEILLIIKYSNPMKLRKIERDEKKAKRRKMSRKVNWTSFSLIASIALIITTLLAIPYITNSCQVHPTNEYTIENNGLFVSSYTILPESSYGILQPDNMTSLLIDKDSSISMCPLIIPVFWVDMMAKINPVIPCLFFIVIFTIIATLILIPIWYRKSTIHL